MAYIDKSGHVRSSANPSDVVRLAFPKLPRATTYYNPTSYNSNYTPKDPNDYITNALGFLPVNTKYLSNTTNGFAMNSYADALFNKEASRRLWEGTILDHDTVLGGILNATGVTSTIINPLAVTWNTIAKPIGGSIKMALEKPNDNFGFWDGLSAGLSTAAVNSLINIGNTLDIVANPVKGAIIESIYGDGASAGFQRGLFGDSEYGRKQYDWADYVDNGLLAFGLEIISDPINLISFGTKTAASSGSKAVSSGIKVMTNTLDDVADTVLDVAKIGIKESIEEAPEAVTKRAGKIITKHVDDTAKTVYKYTLSNGDDAVPVIKQALLDKTGKEFSDEMITNYLHAVVDGDTVSDALIKSTLDGTKKMITRIASQHVVDPYDLVKKQDVSKNLLRVRKPMDLPNNYGEIMADALSKNKRLRSGAFGIFGKSAPPAVQSFYANQIADLTLKDLPKFARYAKAYNIVNYLDDNIRNFALIGTGIYPAFKGGVKAAKYIKGVRDTKYASKMLRQSIENTADWLLPERLDFEVDFNKTANIKEVKLPSNVQLGSRTTLPTAEVAVVRKVNKILDQQVQHIHRLLKNAEFDEVSLSKIYNRNVRTLNRIIDEDTYLKSKGVKTFEEYVEYFKKLNVNAPSYNSYAAKLMDALNRYTKAPSELDVHSINMFRQRFLRKYSTATAGENLDKFLNDDVTLMRSGVESWLKDEIDVKAHKKNRIKHAPVSAQAADADIKGIVVKYTSTILDTFLKNSKDPIAGAEQFFKEIAAELDRFGSEYGSGKPEALFKDDLLQECYSKFMSVLESFNKNDFAYKNYSMGIPDVTFKKYEELVSEYFNFLRQLNNHISFKNTDDTLDATQITNGLGESLLKNTTADKGYSTKDVRLAIEALPLFEDLDKSYTYFGGFSNIDEIIKYDIWGYAPTVSRYNLVRHFDASHKDASAATKWFIDWANPKGQLRSFFKQLSDLDNNHAQRIASLSEADEAELKHLLDLSEKNLLPDSKKDTLKRLLDLSEANAQTSGHLYKQVIEDATAFLDRGLAYVKLDKRLRKLFANYSIDENLTNAFLDALLTRGIQNTYNLQPDKILKTVEDCFNNAEQNMGSILNKPKLNQSYLAYKTAEQLIHSADKNDPIVSVAENLIKNLEHAHDALADITNWATAFLQLNPEKLEMLRAICERSNGTAIAFDLESTGLLDYKTKELFQLSAGVVNTTTGVLENTKLYRIKVSGKNIPDPTILQTFFDSAAADEKEVLGAILGADNVTPESWFKSVYVNCNHPYYADGTWEPALTEKQALKKFYEEFVKPNPNPIFAGHNVTAFDSEFLISNPEVCPELTAAFKKAKEYEHFFDTFVIDYNKMPLRFDRGTRDHLCEGILKAIHNSHLADTLTREAIVSWRQIRAIKEIKSLALSFDTFATVVNSPISDLFNAKELKTFYNRKDHIRAVARYMVDLDCYWAEHNDILFGAKLSDYIVLFETGPITKQQELYSCIDVLYKKIRDAKLEVPKASYDARDAVDTAANLNEFNMLRDALKKNYVAIINYTRAVSRDNTWRASMDRVNAIYDFVCTAEACIESLRDYYTSAQNEAAMDVWARVLNKTTELNKTKPTSFDEAYLKSLLQERGLDKTFEQIYKEEGIDASYPIKGVLNTDSIIDLSDGTTLYNPLAQLLEDGIKAFVDDFNLAGSLDTAANIKRVSKGDYGPKALIGLYNGGMVDVPGYQNILSIILQRTAGQGQSPFGVKTLFNKNFANYFDPELIKKVFNVVNEDGEYVVPNSFLHKLKQMADGIARVRKNISDDLADAAYEDACEILKALANDTTGYRRHHANLLYKNLYETADRKANTVAVAYYLQKNIALMDNVSPELLAKAENLRSYNSLIEQYGSVNAHYVNNTFKMGTVDDAGTFVSWYTTEYGTYDDFYKMCKLTKEHIFEEMTEFYDQHHIFNAVKNAKIGMFRELEKNLGWLRDYLKDQTFLDRSRILTQLSDIEKLRTAGALNHFLNRKDRVEMFIREAHFSAGRKLLASESELDLSDFKKAGIEVYHTEAILQEGSKFERTAHLYFLMVPKELMDKAEALPEDWFIAKTFTHPDIDENVLKLYNDILKHLGGFVQGLDRTNGSVLTKDKIIAFDSFVPDTMRVAPNIAVLETLETSEVEIIRQGLRKKEVVKTENFFSTLRADNMIIGDIDVQRIFDPYTAVNPVRRYAQVMMTYINKHIDGVTLYYNLIANEATNINTNPMFKQLADRPSDFLEVWKAQDEYVAVYLEASKHTKTGIRVREFTIVNEKSVEVAKELNVCIIPKTQYYEVVQTVNQFKLPALFEVLKEVSSFYKIGYLTSIGWVLRNIIDSNYKNHVDVKDTVNVVDQIKDLLSTVKLVQNYNTLNLRYGKAFDNISEYYVFWHYFNDTPEAFAEYISKTPKRQFYAEKIIEAFKGKDDVINEVKKSLIAPELFNLTDLFIKNGPSAGISRHLIDTTGKNIKSSQVVSSFGPVRCVMDFNTMVEQSARLQRYLYDIQRGASMDEAVANVIKTHFDYADKSLVMLYTEIIFPFMSFSFKNLKYWLETICESGAMTSELAKLLRTVLQYNNLFDADYDVYRNYDYSFDFEKDVLGFESNQPWQLINAARLYHLLSGNIVRDTGKDAKYNNGNKVVDADLYRVFKLSPSIMDAVSMLFTPLNQFEQRMLPPYEVLLHCVQSAFNEGTSLQEDLSINGILNNLPFVGATLQRLGVNGDGSTKSNNVIKRIEDDGIWQAVSSLFTAAYVPHKKYNTWYGADNQYLTQLPQYEYAKSPYYYSRLGGFKMNYTMTRYRNSYYNPNASRYRIESLAHSPYYKSPYSKSKRSTLRTTYYSSLTYNALSDNLLKKRVLDKYRYL